MDDQMMDKIGMGLAIFLLFVLTVVGLFDIVSAFHGRQTATVSDYIHSWSLKFPLIPFLAGLLAGHLWFK